MKSFKFTVRIVPFLGIFVIAAVFGFFNHFRSIPLFADYSTPEGRAAIVPSGIKTVTLDEVRKATETGSHTIVDARLAQVYAEAHIPHAVNVPEDSMEPLSVLMANAPDIRPESPIIFYCDGGSCEASINLAEKFQLLGFKNLSVYLGGWQEWVKKQGAK
jgi:3-mercaptopyruvate sulfurtransferase SseA